MLESFTVIDGYRIWCGVTGFGSFGRPFATPKERPTRIQFSSSALRLFPRCLPLRRIISSLTVGLDLHKEIMAIFTPEIGSATRWRKGGPSPNPGGRPRSREFSEVLRTKLAELRLGDPEGRTNAEALAINLIELACSQSRNAVAAIGEIIDRTPHRRASPASRLRSLKSQGIYAGDQIKTCSTSWNTTAGRSRI
jgi:hypothetical protein